MKYGFLTDKDETFSFRKLMTLVTLTCFAAAMIGFLIVNKFAELPASYQAIIAGVFAFYFGKEIFQNLTVRNK